MSRRVVYEVCLRVPAERSAELDAWLPGHIDEMLALPGFIEASRFDPVVDRDGRAVQTVQYLLSDRAALDDYLRTHAERMRESGRQLFGDDLDASRNVHVVVAHSERADARCLNCNAILDGQYCWNCGQRGNTRLISLMELVRDAVGDMFELDSRLWRTLLPLILKPGYLTAEYLRGRRARYMPPFRMYLVVSFVFFLLARSLGENGASINFDNTDDAAITGAQTAAISDAVDQRVADAELSEAQRRQVESALSALDPEAGQDIPASADTRSSLDAQARDDDERIDCEIRFGNTGISWIDSRLSEARTQAVCDDIASDRGRRFLDRVAQNTPVAALALLPLLALLLKLLYPLSRRYYVEHLLLLVHYHAFAFLAISVTYLYNAIMGMTGSPGWVTVVPNIVVGIYIPLYLYKAMRRVYEQSRLLSIFKYLMLLGGYLGAILLVMVVMLLYIIITY